jgi:hypothetical protein
VDVITALQVLVFIRFWPTHSLILLFSSKKLQAHIKNKC